MNAHQPIAALANGGLVYPSNNQQQQRHAHFEPSSNASLLDALASASSGEPLGDGVSVHRISTFSLYLFSRITRHTPNNTLRDIVVKLREVRILVPQHYLFHSEFAIVFNIKVINNHL
jgi:hypothetical protein